MSEIKKTAVNTENLVSIIIPVYNASKTLGACIESVLGQSYSKLELLLVNDGSKDSSGEISASYALKDKRITVFNTENRGPAAARNIGLDNLKGAFIFFLDADDILESKALEILLRHYESSKAEIIIGGFVKTKDGVVEERRDIPFLNDKILNKEELVEYARSYLHKPNKHLLFAFSWGRLFKSSIFREKDIYFDSSLHTFEDVAFNFEYLKYVNSVFVSKENVYKHAVSNNYLSATMSVGSEPLNLFGYRSALIKINEFLEGSLEKELVKKEIGHAYVFLTIIQFVRVCGQTNTSNEAKVRAVLKEIINSKELKESLKYYSPEKGESKFLPLLMRLGPIGLIIFICKYKARKRYLKLEKK